MLPGEHEHAEEILSEGDPARAGNTTSADLISIQPLHASDCPADASQDSGVFKEPEQDFQKSTCSQCGLTLPDRRLDPVSRCQLQLQSSKSSVNSGQSSRSHDRSRSEGRVAGSPRAAATPADSCFHLLLACLWCQGSVLLLGLLEACSCCMKAIWSSSSSSSCSCCCCCCRACARCCSEVQDTPMEELNCHVHCHSVMFESCCEPTECLEFCLDCCEICHRG